MLGVDLNTPLDGERLNSLVDTIARSVVDRRLETPAVFFLEAHKPLSFVASQAVLVAMPFLSPVVGAQRMADFSRLLRDRENVELLLTRIENLAAARDGQGTSPLDLSHSELREESASDEAAKADSSLRSE